MKQMNLFGRSYQKIKGNRCLLAISKIIISYRIEPNFNLENDMNIKLDMEISYHT